MNPYMMPQAPFAPHVANPAASQGDKGADSTAQNQMMFDQQ
jgi:hypothetical protein